jgi:hypothetical protein
LGGKGEVSIQLRERTVMLEFGSSREMAVGLDDDREGTMAVSSR